MVLSRGELLNFDGVKVEVLNPAKNDLSQALSDNNQSIVLRIIYGERKFLLTGDIEREAESELVNISEFVKSDVVKVAHHGSRTSSIPEFIILRARNWR
jgi:competence protein ComEC